MIKTRLYRPSDYPTILSWWKGHGVAPISDGVLPQLGVVVEEDGQMLAACWIYLAVGVGVAWLAWLTSNPENPPLKSARAIKVLVGAAQVALPTEYSLLVAMPQQESFCRLLQREGFEVNHQCTEMFKKLPREGTCPL